MDTSANNRVVEEIDRIMQILPDSLIGEYLKFDEICDLLLDLRQLAASEPVPHNMMEARRG